MNRALWKRLVCLPGLLVVMIGVSAGSTALAQVPDADCFSGACGGSKGIPQCPKGYEPVGWVLYANSKANTAEDCETVVSCTNLGRETVELNCRFLRIQPFLRS